MDRRQGKGSGAMGIRLVARWGASVTVGLSLLVTMGGPAIGLISPRAHAPFAPGLLRPLGDRDVVKLGGVSDWGLAEPGSLAISIDDLQADDPSAIPDSGPLAALSDPIPLSSAAPYVAGVTWDADVALKADARYFRAGAWGGWQELAADGMTGDKPGTESRRGTEPFIVTDVDAIQVRVYDETGVPTGLSVHLYSSAATSADATPPVTYSTGATRLVNIPQPAIHTRAEWGAKVPKEWFESVTVQGAVVHHSAGTNDYLPSDVPEILRSIQDLHTVDRGWSDIAYNFLIDRYGEIWEGRAGGIEQAARGAHSSTFNPIATGVCIMGNFQEQPVPPVAVDSLVALLAWKLTLHGTAADGLMLHEGVWPGIIGHKDIPESSTACPGKWLYALLPEIRARVLAAQHLPSAPFTTDVTGDGIADVATIVGDEVVVQPSGYTTASPTPFQGAEAVGDLGVSYDLITAGPSLTGAQGSDIVARQASTGFLVRIADGGTGVLGEPVVIEDALAASFVLSPGDVTGDGIPDLVGGDLGQGVVAVQAGDGAGRFAPLAFTTPALGALRAIGSAGDVNGDGVADLVMILADSGTLAIALADGKGGFGAPVALGTGWGEFDQIAAMGDVNGDGFPDILVRDSLGDHARTLLGAEGGPTGAFVQWRALANQWTSPMGAVGWGGANGATLLALDASTGYLVRPTPATEAAASASVTLSFSAPGILSAAVVGDVDHNGFADVITWGADGLLLLHESTGTGFATPIVVTDPADDTSLRYVPNLSLDVAADLPITRPYWAESALPGDNALPIGAPFWSEYTSVAPAGDIDFDGTPDLVAVTKSGDVVVYVLNSADLAHPGRGIVVAQGLAGYRVAGVGPWRQGSISDLVAVSPAGDVRLITGKGLTGAIVGGVLATGLSADTVVRGLGQVGTDGGAAVSILDSVTGSVSTMTRADGNDWVPLEAPAP